MVGQNVLGRRPTNVEACEAVGSMLEEANHMKRLIDGLLALTRDSLPPVAPRESLSQRTALDVSQLARRCVQSLHILAEEKQQSICVERCSALWAPVDLTMVRQALLNVIHNAIEHCPEGSEIRIETSAREGAALIVVSDNGPGIALEDQPRVFERFYRGSGASRRRGLGLGLAIARALLISQGGSIQLQSAPGAGCRFQLSVPMIAPSVVTSRSSFDESHTGIHEANQPWRHPHRSGPVCEGRPRGDVSAADRECGQQCRGVAA